MRTKEELINEIGDRNKVRAEAGLPLVSVPKELERISKAELWQDFCDWYKANPILRAKVAEEVLQTFRKDLRTQLRVRSSLREVSSQLNWQGAI